MPPHKKIHSLKNNACHPWGDIFKIAERSVIVNQLQLLLSKNLLKRFLFFRTLCLQRFTGLYHRRKLVLLKCTIHMNNLLVVLQNWQKQNTFALMCPHFRALCITWRLFQAKGNKWSGLHASRSMTQFLPNSKLFLKKFFLPNI